MDYVIKEINVLEEELLDQKLWQDQKKLTPILQKKKNLEEKLETYNRLNLELKDLSELYELYEEDKGSGLGTKDIVEELNILFKKTEEFKNLSLFDPLDYSNCFLELNAGAGGVESHDWVSMIMRMYLRFAERMGYKSEIINLLEGEEAGIKSCCIKFLGSMSYGWMKTENGVHRLVRISPFNSAKKRMTSFASVSVYPEVGDLKEVEIEDKDIRIDTYRSSGAGGQHVNTTDSAVRITHIPTKIVVQCQNQRSQHKNKAEALKMLVSRLYELEKRKKDIELNIDYKNKGDNAWGNQIRSYVLNPYQMVKDLRSNYQTFNVTEILDGNLKELIIYNLSYFSSKSNRA